MSADINGLEAASFLERICRHLKLLGDPASLSMESNLYDLGLDSTGALNLLLEIEEAFGVVFPDSLLNDATFATPSALRSALMALIQHQ